MSRALPLLLAIGAIFVPGCARTQQGPPVVFTKGSLVATSATGTATLHVEVADTSGLRDEGLMGRTTLAPDAGMAFVWTEPTTSTFWMKDTLIPLSIAFWDASGKIVAIKEMTPCSSDPCQTYGSSVPFVGAVEANPGWFDRNGIQIGDSIQLMRAP